MRTPELVAAAQANRAQSEESRQALLQTMERSLEAVRHVFGASHRYYADALEHYAKALHAVGDTDGSVKTLARATEIRAVNGTPVAAPVWERNAIDEQVMPRVLDAQGAARYLSLGLDTLYRLVRSGELPHSRVGKSIRFRPEDLDAYIASRVTREWTRVDRRGRPRQKPIENPPAT
jgi:excisionase family DNA binding protein